MDEDHIHPPVAGIVLVLDMTVIGQHQVDAGLILVTPVLLVKVAQGLGGWQTDQQVGVLLPLSQLTHPAGLEDGLVILRMQADVGDDLSDDGLDSCIVRVGFDD